MLEKAKHILFEATRVEARGMKRRKRLETVG
jgi:hypothetical protein